MFEEYYGFEREPFNITPDPDFLYLSDTHREALAQLIYGVDTRKGLRKHPLSTSGQTRNSQRQIPDAREASPEHHRSIRG